MISNYSTKERKKRKYNFFTLKIHESLIEEEEEDEDEENKR